MSEKSPHGLADAASIRPEMNLPVETPATLASEQLAASEQLVDSRVPSDGALPSDSADAHFRGAKGDNGATWPCSTKQNRKNRRTRRTNWMLWSLLVCLFMAFFFYVFVLPEWELGWYRLRNPQKKFLPPELEMKWMNRTLLRACEFLFVGWFFYFGASIGSFLNVVAWRVPEGRTIVFGGSKCPFCNTHLAFIDNTPILGWLTLQGRCRTCRLPIASRYLWIEVAVGTVFMWLAMWQWVRGSTNLPHWNPVGRAGLINIVLDPHWPSIGLVAIHAALFGILIMLATANIGRKPFPVFALCLIGFGLASFKIFWPTMDLIAWYRPFSLSGFLPGLLGDSLVWNPIASVLVGAVVGGSVGWVSSHLYAQHFGPIVGRHWTLQCFLVGTVLGWQSAVTIVGASLIAYTLLRPASRLFHPLTSTWSLANRAIGLNACFILIALVHHSLWLQIALLLGLA